MRPCYWHAPDKVAAWSRFHRACGVWRGFEMSAFDIYYRSRPRRSPAPVSYPQPSELKELKAPEDMVAAAVELLAAREAHIANLRLPCAVQPCPHCDPPTLKETAP